MKSVNIGVVVARCEDRARAVEKGPTCQERESGSCVKHEVGGGGITVDGLRMENMEAFGSWDSEAKAIVIVFLF